MYPSYAVRTGPCVARRAPRHIRALSNGPNFLPAAIFSGARHHPFFGPPAARASRGDVFDHFDDFVNRSLEGLFPQSSNHARNNTQASSWQPRFDVREVDDAYQLRGEIPGVEAQDLSVEFTDANKLVIRGQTQSERSEGQQPQAAQQEAATNTAATAESSTEAQEADKSDAASIHSDSSYVQPTVDDEADATRRESGAATESTADAPGVATPNTDNTVAQQTEKQAAQPQQPQSRYWISERSTGSFARTFEFPGRINAEGVTASLKNGILDVNVPKAKAPEPRKIEVQ